MLTILTNIILNLLTKTMLYIFNNIYRIKYYILNTKYIQLIQYIQLNILNNTIK